MPKTYQRQKKHKFAYFINAQLNKTYQIFTLKNNSCHNEDYEDFRHYIVQDKKITHWLITHKKFNLVIQGIK